MGVSVWFTGFNWCPGGLARAGYLIQTRGDYVTPPGDLGFADSLAEYPAGFNGICEIDPGNFARYYFTERCWNKISYPDFPNRETSRISFV